MSFLKRFCPLMVLCMAARRGLTEVPWEASVVTASDSRIMSDWSLDPAGGVSIRDAEGGTVQVAASEAMVLDLPAAEEPVTGFPQVRLRSGEVLTGEAAIGEGTEEIRIATALFGVIRVKTTELLEIRYSAVRPGPVAAPCVVLANGDVVAGEIVAVGEDRVVVNSVFGDTPIDRRVVGRLVFASEEPLTDGRDPDEFLVILGDGQRVYADGIQGTADGSGVGVTRGGVEARVPKGEVRRVVFPGWRCEYLTRIPYEAAEAVPYFDGPVEIRVDRNAAGGPLWLGGRWFEHGLGAQPRSRVRFRLQDEWSYLLGWVGLDDHLGKLGDASLALVADGGIRWSTAEVTAGSGPTRIGLELRGVKELELVTDFGARGPIGDMVDWCEMLLLGRREDP